MTYNEQKKKKERETYLSINAYKNNGTVIEFIMSAIQTWIVDVI